MAVYKAHHMGLGLLNQSFPLWDLGAWTYWTPRHRRRAQVKGGLHPNFLYQYSGSSDDYTEFDPGRAKYVEHPAGASAEPPLDGHFAPARTNTFNTSNPAAALNRGPFTLEAGMTLLLITPPVPPHILEILPGPAEPADATQYGNLSTGSPKRAYRQEESSATLSKMWSVLAKQTNGQQIDGSVMTVGVSALADPLGPNIAGATTYRRVRDDGWYQVSAVLPPQGGAPDVFYWFEIADNTNIVIESPQSEGFSTTIEEATAPILTDASPDTGNREVHEIDLSGLYSLPRQGWIGATIIPRVDGGNAGGVTYPTSIILEWQVDGSNRHRMFVSNSAQAITYQMEEGGTSQAFLNSDGSDLLQGEPRGVVATWGIRQGSFYAFMAQDGNFIEIDTGLDTGFPLGAASMGIGSSASSTSNVANVQIQSIGVGNRALSRHDCRILSRWFKTQAQANLGLTGV